MANTLHGQAWIRTAAPGLGYIAGETPDGIVTLDNVPGRAEVDLLQRSDHAFIARQISADDGTYRFPGVPLGVEFDIIGRDLANTWGDVIVSRVLAYAAPAITTPSLAFVVGLPATTQMAAQYGTAPLVWTIDTLPPGLAMDAAGLWSGTGTASSTAVVITVTDMYGSASSKAFTVVIA